MLIRQEEGHLHVCWTHNAFHRMWLTALGLFEVVASVLVQQERLVLIAQMAVAMITYSKRKKLR